MLVRLDLSIYDGFSGGALVDSNGAVIGIDNSGLARGTPTALPASTVDRVVDELLERGHIRRPFIGVAVQQVALNAATVARHKLSGDGALVVVSIADGSPAESAMATTSAVPGSGEGFASNQYSRVRQAGQHHAVPAHPPWRHRVGGQPLRRPTDLLDALSTVADGASLDLEHIRGSTIAQSKLTPIDRGAREATEGDDR